MSLPRSLAEHKTMLAALLLIARWAAERLAVPIDISAAAAARHVGLNRTYIYEVAQRVVDVIEPLAATRPGRPLRQDDHSSPGSVATELTIAVLRFHVEHPGSVTPRTRRTTYSPAFRRFVLEQHDRWPAERTLEEFSAAACVPLDTLRDWIVADREGMTPPIPPPLEARVPVQASGLVQRIAGLFEAWQGSTRQFIGTYADRLGLVPGQVRRVLILLCLIAPQRPRGLPTAPRYRGETQQLSPGALLVTDGKSVHVALTGSGGQVTLNWQAMVDQATGCNTAVVVNQEECAGGVMESFLQSLRFLGGRAPDGLLHDNKPCYQDSGLEQAVAPVELIASTPGRAQNKALVEGAFGKFEQHVGAIELDDSNREALIKSAVREVIRAYCAGVDHAPREEFGGKSRSAYLRDFVPSEEQRRRDLKFLAELKERHRPGRPPRQIEESRRLLDLAFDRIPELRDKDLAGSTRQYLAQCEPAAVREGLALLKAKLARDAIDVRYAHRYLKALIENRQHEHDLQRCEIELLDLAELQQQWWTQHLEQDLERMRAAAGSSLDLARAVAEQAAHGGLPVEGAFWIRELDLLVRNQPGLNAPLRTYLVRLYEAPSERRLTLIDRLAALERKVG